MSDPRTCPSCASPLEEGDRFCPSCGREVAQEAGPGATAAAAPCPLCGQENPPTAATCSSCGAKLRDLIPADVRAATAHRAAPRKGVSAFQSWKFTLGVAGALIVALFLFVRLQPEPEHVHTDGGGQADPHDVPMMNRLRELQAQIEANPKDAPATLELANLLYDVRFFERAAQTYDRYLELEPGNTDARVDLGTSYFQMAVADSSRAAELLGKAEVCFRKAIETKPAHQLAHFNLGVVQLQQGNLSASREWFRKCIAIDSTSEIGRRARELMSEHVPAK